MGLPYGYSEVAPGKIAAVVTSLEMFARPQVRPGPANYGWTVQKVARPDVEWYRNLYRRVGSQWLWFSRLQLSDRELELIIRDPQVEIHALKIAGQDEGMLELDFRQDGECELSFLGLVNSILGTGAGRLLMNRAIECAWSRLIKRFWVHTCTIDHPAALAFYIRSGFRPFKREIEIADDPRLTGLLPRTAAPHVPLIDAPIAGSSVFAVSVFLMSGIS